MDLGLLYEFDVPQPWAGEHPWGQRTAERRVYKENIEQIVLADKVGFDTVWCVEHHFRENRSHMPGSEAVLGALSQITERIKLGFGLGKQNGVFAANTGGSAGHHGHATGEENPCSIREWMVVSPQCCTGPEACIRKVDIQPPSTARVWPVT